MHSYLKWLIAFYLFLNISNMINKIFAILFFTFLVSITGFSQTQIGNDINGEAAGDFSGISVSLSANGDILAVGAVRNDENGTDSGHARIYENQSGNWVQIGQDINSDNAYDNSGISISLSSDGSIVAIGSNGSDPNGFDSGHVRIYEYQAGNWVQIGQDIDGDSAGDWLGISVSLSSDGNTVAIGANYNDGNGANSGLARIYENQAGTWVQIGQDIEGVAAGDIAGYCVSLSADGATVAVGAPWNDNNGTDSGQVRVFENQSGNWIQIGPDIYGETGGGYFGWNLSLSSDASTLAIGARLNDSNGTDAGHVRVYENQSGNWVQVGQDIYGVAAGDQLGTSVYLSADGSVLVAGAARNDGNGIDSGQVMIFENISGSWTKIGCDVFGEAAGDRSGTSLSLNNNGSIVAIGARNNDGNGPDSGHVRVYDLECSIIADTMSDVSACGNYELETLINGNYFTQTGGTGTALNAGDFVTTTQTIYIYNEDINCIECNAESSFTVTITSTPVVDTINDLSSCNSYALPNLTDGNYFTQIGGTGTALFAGDVITTSQTIYIYNEDTNDPTCNAEV